MHDLFTREISYPPHIEMKQRGLYSVVWLWFGVVYLYVDEPVRIVHVTV